MWPYWFLFVVLALAAIQKFQSVLPSTLPGQPLIQWLMLLRNWVPVFVLITLMIGLRHEVGGDWSSYMEHIDTAPNSLADALALSDPAYSLLNWVSAEWGLGMYFVNGVCGALFTWGLVAFCRRQPLPWLALVVAVPYLITVVAMGYTRQGVAIGLVMLGLAALDQGRVLRFVLWTAFAATFHRSAMVLLPLAALSVTQHRFWLGLLAGLAAVLLSVLVLQESVEGFRTNYLETAYHSSGAAIRVAMNALPAVLFLLLRKRFDLLPEQRIFWTWIALGGIVFLGLLYVSPSSTVVDRLALYWIPLQLFVWSRLPIISWRSSEANPVLVYGVVAYCALVLFVWLFYADYAFAWLPYQFYPWVLWQQ